MNAGSIASRLNDASGFKPLFGGIFGGGKAKKSYKIYSAAGKKGVYPLHKVRSAKHEDTNYAIFAFSLEGEVSPEDLKLITDRCANLSLGTIRFECSAYSKLELWRGMKGSSHYDSTEITGIAPECAQVLVFPVAYRVDTTFVIYAHHKGEHHIYPITDKQAAAVVG